MTPTPATALLTAPRPVSVAFVLVSYRPDEPAGIERATAAMAAGLRGLGHRAVIITAAPQPGPDTGVIRLGRLPVSFPCDDVTLRDAIETHRVALAGEVGALLTAHRADLAVYADGLWGLGRLAGAVRHPARRVAAVHVIGHDVDLAPALAATHQVIAPSAAILAEARARGYDTADWHVVPNPLLIDPDTLSRPDARCRERLRRHGPVRVVARLGAEKGVAGLLRAAVPGGRAVHVALAWREVPGFLAGAAVTIVPSTRETFGNLAVESLSAATPVVAYAVGNLPALLASTGAGVLVPPGAGPRGLWQAAENLLADPLRYRQACGAAYCRSRNYRPTSVADAFLKAVR